MAGATELIERAYGQFVGAMPALERLALVIRLELPARGDVQLFRVQTPGPEVTKSEAGDARIDVSVPRATFNELVAEGSIERWHAAYDRGEVKVGGDPDVLKLLGNVIAKHEARSRLKRVR